MKPSAFLLATLSWITLSSLLAAVDDFEKPPIDYSKSQPENCISRLQQKLTVGSAKLNYDERFGYLPSLLDALKVPQSSQMFVFSKTSVQRHRISPLTPRAVYFNDGVYVGYCQQGEIVEISAVDPNLGAVFYTLDQQNRQAPTFSRQTDNCLLCHGSSNTEGVPGHLVRSLFSDRAGQPILSSGSYRVDHTTPLKHRWGGWYVSGTHGKQTHLGNLVFRQPEAREPVESTEGLNVTDLSSRFETKDYLAPHSDLVALMVLEHQTKGQNLLTRANFEARMALHQEKMLNQELKEPPEHRWNSTNVRIRSAGDDLVKYLLFCEEAELTDAIRGTSTFAADFTARGPRDSQGRSLRDFDLQRRMFKYPCSYLIYTPEFDALPDEMRNYVYGRLWAVLSGEESGQDFAHLAATDRQVTLEILRETKTGLPASWLAQ